MSAIETKNITRRTVGMNFWLNRPNETIGDIFARPKVSRYKYEVLETEEAVGTAMLEELKACVFGKSGDATMLLLGGRGAQALYHQINAITATGELDEMLSTDLLVKSGGTVLITEIPEFCGAEHIVANRAKNAETGRAIYRIIDWYKDYASKFSGVLNNNPSPGNIAGGLLNITIKSLGAMSKSGTTRVEGICEYAEAPTNKGLNLMQGPGYDQESTPALVADGATVVVFTIGNGTTIGNAIAPVIKLASNNRIFQKMNGDIDISAGGIIEGRETIDEVGARVFEHIRQVASGEIPAKAEINKHREFQFWAGQTVTL